MSTTMSRWISVQALLCILLVYAIRAQGQFAWPNPACWGEPVNLVCSLSGCGVPGATYSWVNASGTFSSSLENPTIYPGDPGYASDTFFLTVQYGPPEGNISGGFIYIAIPPHCDSLSLNAHEFFPPGSYCYSSNHVLTTGGNGSFCLVHSGATLNLYALRQVLLQPGTVAEEGSLLHVTVGDSGNPCNPPGDVIQGMDNRYSEVPLKPAGTPEWKIFPNPADDYIIISSGNPEVKDVSLTVLTMLGKTIWPAVKIPGDHYRLPLAGLAPGTYWIRLESNGYPVIKQMIRL